MTIWIIWVCFLMIGMSIGGFVTALTIRTKPKEKTPPYIGEVYYKRCSSYYGGSMAAHNTDSYGYDYQLDFVPFRERDTKNSHDGYIEILGMFHKKENVFYYDDIYTPLKKKIIKRNTK